MKKISKNLYDACEYYLSKQTESYTSVAEKFKTDRHSLVKHLEDYKLYEYQNEEYYYLINAKEKEPVEYFISHPDLSLLEVCRRFGTKPDTIKRRMSVMGIPYETRQMKKYNRKAFSNIISEEQAYWVGFILADGYVNEDRNSLRIKLGQVDRDHLIKFSNFMDEPSTNIKSDVGGAYTKDNVCYYVEFNSKEIVSDLKKYNIHQRKSGVEKPYCFNNIILDNAYIRGLIDGDGHVEDGYFKLVGSLEICQYVKDYFSKWYNFQEDKKYIYEYGTIFSLQIRSKKVNDILYNLYNNASIYLDRKYQVVQNFKV